MAKSDYDKERASIKGEEDAKRSSKAGVLAEFFSSSYNPPSDPELKARYIAGWEKEKK